MKEDHIETSYLRSDTFCVAQPGNLVSDFEIENALLSSTLCKILRVLMETFKNFSDQSIQINFTRDQADDILRTIRRSAPSKKAGGC